MWHCVYMCMGKKRFVWSNASHALNRLNCCWFWRCFFLDGATLKQGNLSSNRMIIAWIIFVVLIVVGKWARMQWMLLSRLPILNVSRRIHSIRLCCSITKHIFRWFFACFLSFGLFVTMIVSWLSRDVSISNSIVWGRERILQRYPDYCSLLSILKKALLIWISVCWLEVIVIISPNSFVDVSFVVMLVSIERPVGGNLKAFDWMHTWVLNCFVVLR